MDAMQEKGRDLGDFISWEPNVVWGPGRQWYYSNNSPKVVTLN